jgi:thiol-disulfide isomerase/thioredoxin
MTTQFTLYSREGCHLCEDMIEQLRPYCDQYQFEIQVIDVDKSPQLQEKYGISVPLLCYQKGENSQEVCKYYLDPVRVLSFL